MDGPKSPVERMLSSPIAQAAFGAVFGCISSADGLSNAVINGRIAAATRGIAQGVHLEKNSEVDGHDEVLAITALEEVLLQVGVLAQEPSGIKIGAAKSWLRIHGGPLGASIAGQLGKLSKTRIARAHPISKLFADLEKLKASVQCGLPRKEISDEARSDDSDADTIVPCGSETEQSASTSSSDELGGKIEKFPTFQADQKTAVMEKQTGTVEKIVEVPHVQTPVETVTQTPIPLVGTKCDHCCQSLDVDDGLTEWWASGAEAESPEDEAGSDLVYEVDGVETCAWDVASLHRNQCLVHGAWASWLVDTQLAREKREQRAKQ